ncbi:cytochrome C-type biogenesis protein [Escherichia coli]|uniref:Cytochrome C-type biogenesis protein n=1 Tax=Escherichia coli TaxID=562 RepID=A0A376ZHV7_ECOLX|nr:cytochrome C-type biogenesis protein [Escherichia coli]
MMASSRLFAWLLFMSVAGAFLVLVNAFVVNDFTVTYVASNSNTQLPVWYRVAATWGAHEGSLLLWVLLMSGWTFAVAIFSQRIPLDIVARVLAIMGMVSVGFCCSFSLPLTHSHARCRTSRLKGAILTRCYRIRG